MLVVVQNEPLTAHAITFAGNHDSIENIHQRNAITKMLLQQAHQHQYDGYLESPPPPALPPRDRAIILTPIMGNGQTYQNTGQSIFYILKTLLGTLFSR